MTAQDYGKIIVKRKWLALLVGLLFTIFWIGGLSGLSMNPDNRVFFSKDNPQLLALETLEKTYSRDDNVYLVMAPKDKNVFSPSTLAAVREMTERLWQTPYSSRVDSISNFQWTRSDEDDVVISDLVEDGQISENVANNAREVALAEPLIKNLLVDSEGLVTGINVNIIMPEDPIASGGATIEIMKFIRDEQARFSEKWPEIDLYVSGGVPLTLAFTEVSMSDIGKLLPMTLLIIFIIAGIALRAFTAALFTGFIGILAVIGMMGSAGYIGVIINAVTSNAPLMLLILSIAHCVHIISTQRQQMRAGLEKEEAIVESLRVNLMPVFITSATTSVGFLSMHFSDSPPFRELGYMLALGNLIAFVNAALVLPSFLAISSTNEWRNLFKVFGFVLFFSGIMQLSHSLNLISLPFPAFGWLKCSGVILIGAVLFKIGSFFKERKFEKKEYFSIKVMSKLSEYVINKQRFLLSTGSIIIVILLIGISQIKLDDTWTTYFSEQFEIRSHSDFLEDNLTGLNAIEYSVPAGEENGINNPEYLANLDKFANWYRAQEGVNHVSVVSDTIKRLNKAMNGDQESFYKIPESQELAAQYLLLYELSVPFGLDLNSSINVSKSATRMTVSVMHASSAHLRELDEKAQVWLANNIPEFKTVGSGLSVIFAHLSERNINSMLFGSFMALVIISIILIFALKSLPIGFLSLIPNIFPAAMAFGLWGYLVGEVGIAIAVVGAMTLGIVVDDTVHFLSKYLRGRKELNKSPEDATRYAFSTVGFALVVTSCALIGGFMILASSGFRVNSDLAQLSMITIAFAIIADFLFLPPLLMKLENFKKNLNKKEG
jgi:hypothetical protein